MTWVKIDDGMPDHPKVVGLSDEAFRLHVTALCYAGKYLTDGFIPALVAARASRNDCAPELVDAGLWDEVQGGYCIHDYLQHQTSRDEVQAKRDAGAERARTYRARRRSSVTRVDGSDVSNAVTPVVTNVATNAELTVPEIQKTDTETTTTTAVEIALPRNKAAKEAVYEIHLRLSEARRNGINAWNLSRLVEEQWDALHQADDIGGCIALTAWYVAELQSRQLTSAEIGRIGQMTKRFGRIALLAIDEAASKDLDDLVSYAFRVAQSMYKEKAL